MRIFGAAIAAFFVFCVSFLILAILCNAISHAAVSSVGVYLSILPAPIALYLALKTAKLIIRNQPITMAKWLVVVIPVAILSLLAGMLPELERAVLNAAAGRIIFGFLESSALTLVSWSFCGAAIRHVTKRQLSQDR